MLFTNVVHRLDVSADARRALEFQWAEARRLGLPVTTLITYPALFNDDAMTMAEVCAGPRDELGLHLHEIKSPRTLERYGVREPVLWLWPQAERMDFIGEMVEAFTERFGRPPASLGGYIIDAWTLARIKEQHPAIRTAITSCFEEGVKMFYGNNRNWLLFSDGGPWNPYFPSKANALAPARDAEEAIDIVAVPHLNRDMIMALSSRDDWFASHPGNVFRARINDGAECPYLFRFLRAWEHQAALNGWSYLNVFVSSPWLLGSHWCVESEDDVRALYTSTLEHLKAREEAGANRNLTMDAFGEAFRERVRPGGATICHWRDELGQSKREVIWMANSHHRSAFDMARGGALVDFRPYDGRLNLDLGPESAKIWNGNAPFLVSAEHTGGHWNTSQHGLICDGTRSAGLCDRRLRADIERVGQDGWIVRARPARYALGDKTAVIVSEWELSAGAAIIVRRSLLDYDGDPADLRLGEVFLGRVGTTEYPDDQRGTVLQVGRESLVVAYSGKALRVEGASRVGADIPLAGISLALSALTPADAGEVSDGTIFSPSFRLQLDFPFTQPSALCLETRPLTNR